MCYFAVQPGLDKGFMMGRNAAGSWLLLVLALAGGLWPTAPAARPEDAPAPEFAAARAEHHLEFIAAEPRPTGSPRHTDVATYVAAELERLTDRVEVQRTRVDGAGWGDIPIRYLMNIFAHKNGRDSTGTLLFVAHLDSVPGAPGAGDDGAAVAALLEMMRALGAAPPLRNDITLLLTDAEELGMWGAQSAMPLESLKDVRAVFNFEGRGSSGPSLMFQTSQPNAWLIQHFAKAVPYPVASSIMASVYETLPNDTDFTVFLRHGFTGLNFAFIGGYENYHQPTDRVENLSPRSLQHHGSHMLGLARHFGELDLAAERSTDRSIYFNPIGSFLLHYPARWMWPLTIFAVILWLGALLIGGRYAAIGPLRCATSLLGLLLWTLLCTGLSFGLCQAILRLTGSTVPFPGGRTDHDMTFFAGTVLLTLALSTSWWKHRQLRVGLARVHLAACSVWLLLLIAACVWLPGGSYLPLVPLACGLLAFLMRRFTQSDGDAPGRALFLCFLPVPLIASTVHLVAQGMMLGLSAVGMPLVVLTAALLWPRLSVMPGLRLLLWLGTFAAFGLGAGQTAGYF